MTKKKRRGGQMSQEQKLMMSEVYYQVRNYFFRMTKFPPANWQAYSEDSRSACGMIMPKISWPAGTTTRGKKEIYENLIMPLLAKCMSDCRNKVTQPIRAIYIRECCCDS